MSQSARKRLGAARKPKPQAIPILLILGGVIVLGLTVFLVTRNNATPTNITPEVSGAPKLKADREAVDLGEVRLGQTVEVTFEIANVGDQPLRFTEAPYIEVMEGC